MRIGVIVLGILPAGVKQIVYQLNQRLTPEHKLIGIELGKELDDIHYVELTNETDSPYLSHSILKLSVFHDNINWEKVCSPIDTIIIIGNEEVREAWKQSLAPIESIRSLFVPVSIYNNIKGNEWTLGYDTAINSITQNILKVKDTIHSLKYEKPRLFGFSIVGNPTTHMLEDIALAVDGHYLPVDYEKTNIPDLCHAISASYTSYKTSNVLIYSEKLKDIVEPLIVHHLTVDWKYTDIDEALCMGINPTAIDRILANELSQAIQLFINNNSITGELVVSKNGVVFQ